MIRILLTLALVGPAVADRRIITLESHDEPDYLAAMGGEAEPSPSPSPSPKVVGVTIVDKPDDDLPAECSTCMKARPIKRNKQWETDHKFAHHLVEVMLRMEARRHTVDAGPMRPILQSYRDQIAGAKMRDKGAQVYLLLDETLKTCEELVYRVERVEAELKACDEARKAAATY